MIGLALSGGGSRAIAFHLGCLRALNDLGILEKVNILSSISGGSVIGAYYAYTPHKSFEEFDADITTFLKDGIQKSILLEILKPQQFFPSLLNFILTGVHETAQLLNRPTTIERQKSRTDAMKKVLDKKLFKDLFLDSERRNNLDIVIGSCDLITGTAFRFGSTESGGWRYGKNVQNRINVSFAVTASAAYPIFLPGIDKTWLFEKKEKQSLQRVILTDGGVYDNLGVQVLEPGRDSKFSVHNFPCDYIIACNAGHGQDDGNIFPLGFLSRVTKSFEVVHKKVQDATMGRLHDLKYNNSLKGFVMPYLGQIDNRLPFSTQGIIPRSEVIDYPTNFGAMSNEWIYKLCQRGEQLTRGLVSCYLKDLLY